MHRRVCGLRRLDRPHPTIPGERQCTLRCYRATSCSPNVVVPMFCLYTRAASVCGPVSLNTIGSILNPLAGKVSEDTRKKRKGAKTRASHDGWAFICHNIAQYDWLKGSHVTKIVWLPNETDYMYSYCEFVAPDTPYWMIKSVLFCTGWTFMNTQWRKCVYVFRFRKRSWCNHCT